MSLIACEIPSFSTVCFTASWSLKQNKSKALSNRPFVRRILHWLVTWPTQDHQCEKCLHVMTFLCISRAPYVCTEEYHLTNKGLFQINSDRINVVVTLWKQYVPNNKVNGAHLGPTRPRWAPCWPHEPCYMGWVLGEIKNGCETWQ